MIRVQLSKDFLPGIFAVVALESLHIHARGVSLAQARGELHLAWTGSSCFMNPPTKPMTMKGGIMLADVAGTELSRSPSGTRSPCPVTGWPSTKMATGEKVEAQIEVPIR